MVSPSISDCVFGCALDRQHGRLGLFGSGADGRLWRLDQYRHIYGGRDERDVVSDEDL